MPGEFCQARILPGAGAKDSRLSVFPPRRFACGQRISSRTSGIRFPALVNRTQNATTSAVFAKFTQRDTGSRGYT